MNDDILLIRLRDCFTGGYTLPQFCIDNHIKKPLFIAEKKFLLFMWEIYVQFRYDKRLQARFSVLDAAKIEIKLSVHGILAPLEFEDLTEQLLDNSDKIFLLESKRSDINSDKFIYLDTLTNYFIRKTYAEIPLLNFLQRYPQVKLILTKLPSISRYKGGLEFNKQLKELKEMQKILRADKSGNVKTSLDKFGYTNQEVLDLIEVPMVRTNLDGSTVMEDTDEYSLQRIKNEKRVTAYQPEKFLNRIYFVGACHDFGINAPFDKTIESHLQKMLNENNLPYRVENESQRYWHRYQDIFYNLNKLTPAPGDIIFVWLDNMWADNLPLFDLSSAFDPPHDFKQIFCVKWHFNELGYKILAEKYFELLTENNFFRDVEFTNPPQSTSASLRYTAALRARRLKKFLQPRA